MPTPEDVQQQKTVPVAFLSRKLTSSQRNWVPREQETYAIVLALMKWETWIGLQSVLVLYIIKPWSTGLEKCWMPPADQSADGRAGTNSSLVLTCQWGTFQGKTTRLQTCSAGLCILRPRHFGNFPNMVPCRMRMKWSASFCGSVWRKGVVCIFLLTRRVVWSKFPGGSGERVQCPNPPYPRSRCGPINRYPPMAV